MSVMMVRSKVKRERVASVELMRRVTHTNVPSSANTTHPSVASCSAVWQRSAPDGFSALAASWPRTGFPFVVVATLREGERR